MVRFLKTVTIRKIEIIQIAVHIYLSLFFNVYVLLIYRIAYDTQITLVSKFLYFNHVTFLLFTVVMTVMAASINEICVNTQVAREMALLGNYEASEVYYQGVIQDIQRLLLSIPDAMRKKKWQSVIFIINFNIYV